MPKMGWFGGLGVTQGHQQHNNSIECMRLPIQLLIETMRLTLLIKMTGSLIIFRQCKNDLHV